jgi:8-oxo-dGTP pyrophosphatase MutT (NUDIX family)
MFRKTALLVILNDKNQIMLCMKKRGFWKWKLNWPWGKQEWNEDIVQTAIRETLEETCLDVSNNLKEVWILHFHFKNNLDWNNTAHIFLSKNVIDKPKETDEMKPYFFEIDKIPYEKMWSADRIWIPRILAWEEVEYNIYFDENWWLEKYKLIK